MKVILTSFIWKCCTWYCSVDSLILTCSIIRENARVAQLDSVYRPLEQGNSQLINININNFYVWHPIGYQWHAQVKSVSVSTQLSFKNTNRQQMHKKSFIINRNTLLHVLTVLGYLQGELFVIVTLRLHFIVEWECAVDCVLRCSHSTIKCNLSVTIIKKFSLKMTQHGRNM
jgi:hypothetical protein